jgi:hypothetical protein
MKMDHIVAFAERIARAEPHNVAPSLIVYGLELELNAAAESFFIILRRSTGVL